MPDAFTKDNYPLVQDTLFLSPFPDVDYPRQPSYPSTHPMESIRVPINTETSASSYHRRGREVDTSSWDDDAAVRLRTTANPAANYCDFISFCRSSPTVRKLINRKYFLDGTRFYHQPFGIIWFVRDPCGIVCLFITWFLILYAEFVISGVILVQAPSPIFCWFTGSLYHLFTVMSVVSHFMAFATDPGTIPIGNATSDALAYMMKVHEDTQTPIIRCPKCLCVKPPRSHHCRVCFRCVRKMDHHCPWINNCVGEGNQKYFVLFTFYICLQCICAIYMSIHFVVQCVDSDWELCQINPTNRFAIQFSPFSSCVFILVLVMESLVFGLFTLIMCISQVHSIAHDETGIESLGHSGPKGPTRSRWKNLAVSCGTPFTWRWFSPFTAPPPVTPVFPGLGRFGADHVPPEYSLSSYCDDSSRISIDTLTAESNSTSVLML